MKDLEKLMSSLEMEELYQREEMVVGNATAEVQEVEPYIPEGGYIGPFKIW